MPRFWRLPCSLLKDSISSKSAFALSLYSFLWSFSAWTSSLILSRCSLCCCASSTNSRVWAFNALRSRAFLLASAFNSLRRSLCCSDSARTFFLFSIRSFSILYQSSTFGTCLISPPAKDRSRMLQDAGGSCSGYTTRKDVSGLGNRDRRSSVCSCVQPRYFGNRRPGGSVPCTIHPVLEGLYKNVYNSNVICTLKYFAGA